MDENDSPKQACFVASYRIDKEHSNKHARMPHVHKNELELFYVYSGAGQYMVDNVFYAVKQGDIVICNAGILHGEDPVLARCMQSYSVAMTNIALAHLPANCLTDGACSPVLSCGQLAEQIGQLLRLIYLLSADTAKLKSVCSSLAHSLLLLVQALLESRSRHDEKTQKPDVHILANRVRQYLDAHHSEPITLAGAAKALNMSEYYLAHTFKEQFGVPPMQYVMKRRIGEAQGLLMDTMLPVAEIAEELGFRSPCHFNTMFNKYVGMPPGKYRDAFRVMKKDK